MAYFKTGTLPGTLIGLSSICIRYDFQFITRIRKNDAYIDAIYINKWPLTKSLKIKLIESQFFLFLEFFEFHRANTIN